MATGSEPGRWADLTRAELETRLDETTRELGRAMSEREDARTTARAAARVAARPVPVLHCVICLHFDPPRHGDGAAVTVVGGHAVCLEHVSTVTSTLGGVWQSVLVIGGLRAAEARHARPRGAP